MTDRVVARRRQGRVEACEGKEAFDAPSLAVKVRDRRLGSGKVAAVYRCVACGKWHLGGKAK